MTITTASGSGQSILTAEQIAALVELPLRQESVAMRTSTIISTRAHSVEFLYWSPKLPMAVS